jgi:hypothetical protein
VILVSFACTCGVEVHLPEHPSPASEIVCVACGEWIGVYADLMPAPTKAKRPHKPVRPKAKHKKKPGRRRG